MLEHVPIKIDAGRDLYQFQRCFRRPEHGAFRNEDCAAAFTRRERGAVADLIDPAQEFPVPAFLVNNIGSVLSDLQTVLDSL